MSAEFAVPIADLGSSVLRHLRNATARFNGGVPVDGVFRNRATIAALGQAGMFAREATFMCAAADVDQVEHGVAVEISSQAAPALYYTVSQREPQDLHTGLVTLVLEPAQ